MHEISQPRSGRLFSCLADGPPAAVKEFTITKQTRSIRYKTLFMVKNSLRDSLVGMSIFMNQPPILYKYLNKNGATKFLENPQLQHRAFSEFFKYDDICDSLATFSELSDSQIESNAIEAASSEKELIFKRGLGKLKPEYLERLMRDQISKEPEAAAYICSLVASPDSIAMWSQYGDHHQGIAFGIPSDLQRVILDRGRFLRQVEYPATNERPHTPFNNPKRVDVRHVLWTKGKEWEYQSEWRIISTNPETDFLQSGEVAEVIFGWRFKQDQRAVMSSQLLKSTRFFEATPCPKHFRMLRREISKS